MNAMFCEDLSIIYAGETVADSQTGRIKLASAGNPLYLYMIQ